VITIDESKCVACGECAAICHEHCITLSDDVPVISYDLCSTCTQCIAICPSRALSWNGFQPAPYDSTRLPSSQQMDELLRERRTIRSFQDRGIERQLLEEIVGCGILAPTNNYALRAIIVDDRELIDELERIVLRVTGLIYRTVFKPRLVFNLIRMVTPAMDPKDKVKIEETLERGSTLASIPAAAVFIVGDRRTALSESSAQYALYNMILYAQSKGIGSCLRGTGQIFLDRSRAARARLGLSRHERIFGTLLLGYPAVRFRNKVMGKALPIQWIGNGSPSNDTRHARESRHPGDV
jgi:nitroreductase/NAD-dependent dihydropyrimidine dehydrogenase PreA subunit